MEASDIFVLEQPDRVVDTVKTRPPVDSEQGNVSFINLRRQASNEIKHESRALNIYHGASQHVWEGLS